MLEISPINAMPKWHWHFPPYYLDTKTMFDKQYGQTDDVYIYNMAKQ